MKAVRSNIFYSAFTFRWQCASSLSFSFFLSLSLSFLKSQLFKIFLINRINLALVVYRIVNCINVTRTFVLHYTSNFDFMQQDYMENVDYY